MPDPVEVIAATGGEPLAICAGAGEAYAVVGPAIGARHRTMAVLRLPAGEATIPLCHPGEAVWYVVEGSGVAAPAVGEPLELDEGTMIHTEPGAAYEIEAGGADLVLVGGPSPPHPGLAQGEQEEPREGARVRRFHRDKPARRVPMISKDARLVVFPGVGAETANMNYVRLQPGEENVAHAHAESEDTIFILAGRGTVVDHSHERTLEFAAGDMIHVPPATRHAVRADQGVEIVSVGGPCPPDSAMLRTAE